MVSEIICACAILVHNTNTIGGSSSNSLISSAVVIFMKNAYVELYLCLHVYITWKRLGKNVTATTDTHATNRRIVFSAVRAYQKGVSGSVCVTPYRC
jgi:hypothetical protein